MLNISCKITTYRNKWFPDNQKPIKHQRANIFRNNLQVPLHKIPEFHLITWCGILWKRTVFVEFRANRPKLCENCAFLQNFHTRKLGEISVSYAVYVLSNWTTIISSNDVILVWPCDNWITGSYSDETRFSSKIYFMFFFCD